MTVPDEVVEVEDARVAADVAVMGAANAEEAAERAEGAAGDASAQQAIGEIKGAVGETRDMVAAIGDGMGQGFALLAEAIGRLTGTAEAAAENSAVAAEAAVTAAETVSEEETPAGPGDMPPAREEPTPSPVVEDEGTEAKAAPSKSYGNKRWFGNR